MQPCAVCGSVTFNAAGYCTQCGTFRGVPPQGVPPQGVPGGYPPPAPQSPYGAPESPYGVPGSPQGYQQPISGSPGYGQPVSGYPTSGPPGGYPTSSPPGYAPPTSGGGYPTSYPPPPGTGGGRSKPFVVPLVALSVTLVILVVAIVVVVIVRSGSKGPPGGQVTTPPSDTNTSQAAPVSNVDSCVVGRWRVTSHREDVAVPDVGKVTFTGGEDAEVELNADGSGKTDYRDGTTYEGEANGRTIKLEIRGTLDFEFAARDGTVSFKNVRSEATAKIFVDGQQYGSDEPFEGSDDPSKYECSGDELVQKTFFYETKMTKVS